MRGKTQSQLIQCSDGYLYVVKFLNNPLHSRVLVNEMLGAQLALMLGLPVPDIRCVNVSEEFVKDSKHLVIKIDGDEEPCATGVQYGSRYPGRPHRTMVIDSLPAEYLREVRNRECFFGAFIFDLWTCNCDARQMIFYRIVDDKAATYSALLIDNDGCFNGPEWTLSENRNRRLICERKGSKQAYNPESFEPFLGAVEEINPSDLESCGRNIPEEWYDGKNDELEQLLEKLYDRRTKIRREILGFLGC